MLGGATAKTYAAALPLLLADTQVDAVVVLFVPTVTATADEVAEAVDGATVAAASEKPVLAVVLNADGIPRALRREEAHVAAFPYPESAARALGRLAERAEWLRQPHGTVPSLDGVDRDAAERIVERALEDADDVWLTPADTRELLLAYGLPLVPERLAHGPTKPSPRPRSSASPSSSRRRSRRAQDRARRHRARSRGHRSRTGRG